LIFLTGQEEIESGKNVGQYVYDTRNNKF